MHQHPTTCPRPRHRSSSPCMVVSAVLATSLAACGGGGGGNDPESMPPSPITLTGVVMIDKAVRNVTVCVDLNTNGACDASEPNSALTGADGKYGITYQPSDAVAAAAFQASPLLARVMQTSVDAANPDSTATQTAFMLSAPVAKSGQINPLTTLVQRAVADGMALEAAETAVAQQLGIAAAKIYGYQDDPAPAPGVNVDTARVAAKITAFALEQGAPIAVVPASAAATESTMLALLTYADAQNYRYQLRHSDGVDDAGYTRMLDTVAGLANGSPIDSGSSNLYLTPAGWSTCDNSTVPRLATRGNPSRTLYCNGATAFLGFTVAPAEDVAGQTIAAVVSRIQAGDPSRFGSGDEGIPQDVSTNVAPSLLGNAALPAGSTLRTAVSVQLGALPYFITPTESNRIGFPTLATLIDARPVSGVNPATGAGTVGGLGQLDKDHQLRVAFVDGSTAQFYSCAGTAPSFSDRHDCVALSQSAYTVETTGGATSLRFASFPAAASEFQGGRGRGYAEYEGQVYLAIRNPYKVDEEGLIVTYNQRLNGTAWQALKSALGIN